MSVLYSALILLHTEPPLQESRGGFLLTHCKIVNNYTRDKIMPDLTGKEKVVLVLWPKAVLVS